MPSSFQEYLIQNAKDHGATVESDRIVSGHFPQISHQDEVVSWIKRLAQKTG